MLDTGRWSWILVIGYWNWLPGCWGYWVPKILDAEDIGYWVLETVDARDACCFILVPLVNTLS